MFVDAALSLHVLLPSSPSAWRAGHPNAYACGKEKEHFHCIQRNISIVLIHIIRIIIIILLRFLSIHDLSIDWQDLFLSLLVFLKAHQQNWVWFVSSLFHAFPAHQLTLYIINNPVHSHKYCLPGFAVAAETERVPHWDRRPANAGALRATFRTSCWASKNLSRFSSDEHDILWIFRNPAPVDKSFITLFINFIRFLPCCRMSSIHSMIETYWDRHHVSEAPVASQCQDLQRRSGASGCRENGQWWTGMGYYLDITWYPLVN